MNYTNNIDNGNTNVVIEKEKNMKKTNRLVVAIVSLSLLVVALFGGVITLFYQSTNYRNRLQVTHEYYYYELANSVGKIETALSKMLASNSASFNSLLASEAYRHSEVAQVMLAQLPLSEQNDLATEKFLNQVGDWAIAYSTVLLQDRDAESYRNQIEELYVTAKVLTLSILEQGDALREGGFSDIVDSETFKDKESPQYNEETESEENSEYSRIVEYPELIYDGTYSDSVKDREYKCFSDVELMSEEEVTKVVENLKPESIGHIKLMGHATEQSQSYEYELDTDKGKVYMSVSPYGGRIVNFTLVKKMGEIAIDEDRAKELAKEYTAQFDYDVDVVYSSINNNVAFITLAPVCDNVIHYTDTVKVKIALDDGELLGLEAVNYCMNHCQREHNVEISLENATSRINENLVILDSNLAIIPYGGTNEILCYEFRCEYKGLEYLIYLSAVDGNEINILRVVNDNFGMTTI